MAPRPPDNDRPVDPAQEQRERSLLRVLAAVLADDADALVEARIYRDLLANRPMTQRALAKLVGRSNNGHVSKRLSLLKLHESGSIGPPPGLRPHPTPPHRRMSRQPPGRSRPARRPASHLAYAYAIENPFRAAVKLGYSTNPLVRFGTVDGNNYDPVFLRVVWEGGSETEKELHARFAACRRRKEWFDLTPDLDAFLDAQTPVYLPPHGRRRA
jgi:hypothetical protein